VEPSGQTKLLEEVEQLQSRVTTLEETLMQCRLEKEQFQTALGQSEAHLKLALDQTAQKHLVFLAEASKVLAATLDYETTLKTITRLVVPHLADFCAVDLLQKNHVIERVAITHIDPVKEALVLRKGLIRTFDPNTSFGPPKALRTGQPELLSQPIESSAVNSALNSEQLAILKALNFHSYICAPLVARGHSLGTITFGLSESSRRYVPSDLELVQELALRIAQAVDNAQLYREAQEAIHMREEFLSLAAHELKTPLTGLRGYAQLLNRQLDKGDLSDLARFRRALDSILEQSDRLTHLVSRLLDVSRLDLGWLVIQPSVTDLTGLVEGVVRLAQANPNKHRVILKASDIPLVVMLDPIRFEQVVISLVDNAIKYSPEGGQVELQLDWLRDSDTITLRVTDQGLGIPVEHRQHIFDRFYQAHRGAYLGGMGLGLHIAQQIVTLHGGQITAEFPEEGGTHFIVTLPGNLIYNAPLNFTTPLDKEV